jgi:hypothetical protein
MDVCLLWVFVLSGRGLCDGPIPRPEEFYPLWCVSGCDQAKITKPRHLLWEGRKGKDCEANTQNLVTNVSQFNDTVLFCSVIPIRVFLCALNCRSISHLHRAGLRLLQYMQLRRATPFRRARKRKALFQSLHQTYFYVNFSVAQVQHQRSLFGIFDGQNGTDTGFCPGYPVNTIPPKFHTDILFFSRRLNSWNLNEVFIPSCKM